MLNGSTKVSTTALNMHRTILAILAKLWSTGKPMRAGWPTTSRARTMWLTLLQQLSTTSSCSRRTLWTNTLFSVTAILMTSPNQALPRSALTAWLQRLLAWPSAGSKEWGTLKIKTKFYSTELWLMAISCSIRQTSLLLGASTATLRKCAVFNQPESTNSMLKLESNVILQVQLSLHTQPHAVGLDHFAIWLQRLAPRTRRKTTLVTPLIQIFSGIKTPNLGTHTNFSTSNTRLTSGLIGHRLLTTKLRSLDWLQLIDTRLSWLWLTAEARTVPNAHKLISTCCQFVTPSWLMTVLRGTHACLSISKNLSLTLKIRISGHRISGFTTVSLII